MHESETPSAWVRRFSHLVPAEGTVLDVACGHGRHMRWFADRGHAVTGVDRDPAALQAAAQWGATVQADIERDGWPFKPGRQFDAVIITNYLWRPLLHDLLGAVAPGGALIHETFAKGNETIGKPSRPDFLLLPGELLRAYAGLRVVAYEDGYLDDPPRFVQRIAAVRDDPAQPLPRHRLG